MGLYTGPHLKTIRERIQIDHKPIDESLFAKNFFHVWNALDTSDLPKPRYLQLMMLLAVHTFIDQGVDVAILETHNGGEFDATNIFTSPVATGIARIGMDHIEQLGPTIENIAWHKSGIFKTKSPAFSVEQEKSVAAVLGQRATEKGVSLQSVRDTMQPFAGLPTLRAAVQRENASLALELANAFLSSKCDDKEGSLNKIDIDEGAKNPSWIGRFQQVVQGKHRWYLDGAHNELSMPFAVEWFAEIIKQDLR